MDAATRHYNKKFEYLMYPPPAELPLMVKLQNLTVSPENVDDSSGVTALFPEV